MSDVAPTAFVAHADCGRHDTGWGHPEHQGRLPALVRALERDTPALLDRVLQREATPATEEDLLRVHTPAHVERVRSAVRDAEASGRQVALDLDTRVSGASWEAGVAAAGCVVTAAELVMSGEARTAFAASRPPGHHATAGEAMGFCLFNNVAVAARALQARHGLERILIVDWDVHHGNGTQDIFYEDPSVYYVSLHLSPHYPGTGRPAELGRGAGAGRNLNVALRRGTGAEQFHEALDAALERVLGEFEPEFLLVSAGFDCLAGDPLGGLELATADLHRATRTLLARAPDGRMVVALEGGYAPERLGAGAVQVIRALAGVPPQD